MAINAAVRLAQAQRRETIAKLYLRHITMPQIAVQLHVNKGTVSRDVKYLIEQWRERAQGPIAQWIAQELAEIDQMEQDAALQFASTRDRQWLETRLHIKDRRAKLLGLDAPQKLEAVGADGQPAPITIAQVLILAERHAQALDGETVEGEVVSLSKVSTNGHG